MAKVGIFFGTDTGNTRRIAKDIATALGSAIAAQTGECAQCDSGGYAGV